MSAKGIRVLAVTEGKTQSENVLKNHELSQERLLSVEAQRISSILENCIRQIEIATTLPAILHLNNVSSVADEDLNRALQNHQLLGGRLETLEGLKQESEGEDGEARKRMRTRIEKDIKNSVRVLLRHFRAHPDAISDLRMELSMEVGESEYKLIRGLKVFHSHMIEKMLTSLDEEQQLASSSPVRVLEEQIIPLEEEIAGMQIDAKISQKRTEIKKLQYSLQLYNTQGVGLSRTDKQSQPHIKTSKKQISLQQKMDQINSQLNNLTLENRQTETELQEKNKKVETEIEYLLQTFDSEVEDIQADLELNEIDCEREEEELRGLEKPFSVLEVECNQIQERRQLVEEKRQKEMKELELKTKAAIFAQAWWRGYSTREALKNKGKSKKAKKRKGVVS